MLTYLYRLLTDRRVACARCAAPLGYVCREGHTAWLCASCAPSHVVEAA